ncbi:MAG: tetratricopeptide repeat protein [Pirellulales bacterium]|nr:tetratricopeptide repeat protein [Pirellulales bacterium]
MSTTIPSDSDSRERRPTPLSGDTPPGNAALLARVLVEAHAGRYDNAVKLAHGKGGQELEVQNALAVCLMRTGHVEEAVRILRGLVMQPGSTWMRKDRPVHLKVNFATALMLEGHTSGALEMLGDLEGETTPHVPLLRAAVQRWEKSLPWLPWLDWKINRVAPHEKRVAIDFVPGEFGAP